jgi:hypothetical protein
MLSLSSIVIGVSICSSFVQAYIHDFSKAVVDEHVAKVPLNTVDLSLDHFGKSLTTISNRYWVNDEFYKPDGPVICKWPASVVPRFTN